MPADLRRRVGVGCCRGALHDTLDRLVEGRGAVRCGGWKLHVGESENGLFNLDDDPSEAADQAARRPEVVAELARAFRAFADPLPLVLNPDARKKTPSERG